MAWLQAIHVASCAAWGGGLVLLCLQLGAHAGRPVGRAESARRTAHQRMARRIITLAAGLTVFTGVWLINVERALLAQAWVQARIGCVLALMAVDALSERGVARLVAGSGGGRGRPYRLLAGAAGVGLGAMLALGFAQPEAA